MDSKQISFKVDIAGIIEIMGSSLYSRADTPIRELIQNAHDAIIRRRRKELSFQGRIQIRQDSEAGTLTFHDDGIGLTPEDAEHYLGTLGTGITGLLKRGQHEGVAGGDDDLIGQFGVGLFSGFMLAERMTVESRRLECDEAVLWEAGAGTEIRLSPSTRAESGTTVTLYLKQDYAAFASDEEALEVTVKEFAEFLTVPIFINDAPARANVINAAWFDPTPNHEAIERELESYFEETPLDVIPIRLEAPIAVAGALYVTPQRTPGFADDPVTAVTVRRMIISRRIHGLLPTWATFLRGVLELNQCAPTASREDLVRDASFSVVQRVLANHVYEHFEELLLTDPTRLESVLAWHRYTFAGAALADDRLRDLLRKCYRWTTSLGSLTFEEIVSSCQVDPIFETEVDRVVWYNTDRRQEKWTNSVFAGHDVPCVHALRSFEESLLAALIADDNEADISTDLRPASPSSTNFATSILGVRDMEPAPDDWGEFLGETKAQVFCASFTSQQPVIAFLNEKYELLSTFEDLKTQGSVPSGFQRLIDNHFEQTPSVQNEIVLNRDHRLVGRALEQNTGSPLASVLRLMVWNALNAAGAAISRTAQQQQAEDLDWIADALWGSK